ncbi:DUF7824 domain-containing protein [Amycolatopsis pigmentata]|uniref:DUF6493 family protein n=1 Tax=Amycolatopsis pigmentata TaxID=450801 RepID=A0ABW5FLQ7_9PSEU
MTAPVPPEVSDLCTAVRRGRVEDLPGLLKALTDAQRRACLPELRARRKELRTARPDNFRDCVRATLIAGAACNPGAAAAAAWLSTIDRVFGKPWEPLFDVLADRGREWLGDLAQRLAGRDAVAEASYELVAGLVRMSGCAVPTSDAFVRGWVHETATPAGPLADRLRADEFTPVLLPRLFDVAEVGAEINWMEHWWAARRPELVWSTALAELAATGFVERDMLVARCVSRLVRGTETPSMARGYLAILAGLDLSADEMADRTGDWVHLVADSPLLVVVDRAQEMLRRLWEGDRLPVQSLAEATRAVLFRTEKKPVRAHFVLLGKALARDRSGAETLLPAVAEGFSSAETDIQDRALKLVARHLDAVSQRARTELAEAATALTGDLRARADKLFGAPLTPTGPDSEDYQEALPAAVEPRRLAPAPEGVDELAMDVVLLFRAYELEAEQDGFGVSGAVLERVLDGLVRHAHRDWVELAEALRPAVRDIFGLHNPFTAVRGNPHPLTVVVSTLLGELPPHLLLSAPEERRRARRCPFDALDIYEWVLLARMWEVALRMSKNTPTPFLLSTPTFETGELEPAELVARLREYQRLGLPVGTVDFEQALLRVRIDESAQQAAEDLGSPEGRRLVEWLRSGGIPQPPEGEHVLITLPEPPAHKSHRQPAMLTSNAGLPALAEHFGEPFRYLAPPLTPALDNSQCHHSLPWNVPVWLGTLPGHRETLAAHLLGPIGQAVPGEIPGSGRCLPALAEAPGPAGPATHLVVAYGLGARGVKDRVGAVDALLMLAATGALDAGRFGKDIAELICRGLLKATRVSDALRTAADGGAHATTFAVLAAALPVLLADPKAGRGAGAFLAVAAECAERCRPVAEIPHLEEIAARRGSAQLVLEARRLLAALKASQP